MAQMLRQRVSRGLVAAVTFLSMVLAFAQAGPTITLYDAIRDSKVATSARGTGASTGPGALIEIAKGPNAGPAPVRVTVPRGTILRNGNGGGQNMVVAGLLGRFLGDGGGATRYAPVSEMVVSSTTPVTYVLDVYCIQFEKDN